MTAEPDSLVSVAVCDAPVWPSVTDANVSDPGANISAPIVPVAVRVAVCGLFAALSLNEIVSLFAPADAGLKITETVQEDPAASADGDAGQLFAEIWKSGPVVIESMIVPDVCEFVSVRVFAPELPPTTTLPQLSAVGDKESGATSAVPTSLALWELLLASSVTVSVAVCEPLLCGVKLTEMVQLAFPASELPQVFVSAKFAFEIPIFAMKSATGPLFVRVKAIGLPLLPAYTDVNCLFGGVKVALPVFGFVPEPLRDSMVPLPELSFTLT